ncbi:MAG: hypothetical protein KKF89_05955 [Nanoarchaeota archaeon]|nr:hypothetical protein [Nanoarchaeota archaeon]MBU1855242.1 hypothetical protein [Nanoarchaeota archaeon]
MSLIEIKRIFEKRRFNLIKTLENGREDIELSKQHQIYGAIKELENIMNTLEYYQELESKNHFDLRLSSEPNKTILQKITLKLKRDDKENNKVIINEPNVSS